MITLANILVGLVILLQVCFLILEMFFWDKPLGLRVFHFEPTACVVPAKLLAANLGLYNGFLAAGLGWGLLSVGTTGTALKLFFLICVVIAGVFGGLTTNRKILLVQALPGAVALALVWLS